MAESVTSMANWLGTDQISRANFVLKLALAKDEVALFTLNALFEEVILRQLNEADEAEYRTLRSRFQILAADLYPSDAIDIDAIAHSEFGQERLMTAVRLALLEWAKGAHEDELNRISLVLSEQTKMVDDQVAAKGFFSGVAIVICAIAVSSAFVDLSHRSSYNDGKFVIRESNDENNPTLSMLETIRSFFGALKGKESNDQAASGSEKD